MTRRIAAVAAMLMLAGCAGFQVADKSGKTYSCVPNAAMDRKWGNEPKAGTNLIALPDASSQEWANRWQYVNQADAKVPAAK